MPLDNTLLPMFLVYGVVLGGLAAAGAFAISYQEYRQRRLRPDQNPRRMALGTAGMTFAFFVFVSKYSRNFLGRKLRGYAHKGTLLPPLPGTPPINTPRIIGLGQLPSQAT